MIELKIDLSEDDILNLFEDLTLDEKGYFLTRALLNQSPTTEDALKKVLLVLLSSIKALLEEANYLKTGEDSMLSEYEEDEEDEYEEDEDTWWGGLPLDDIGRLCKYSI